MEKRQGAKTCDNEEDQQSLARKIKPKVAVRVMINDTFKVFFFTIRCGSEQ
ncbi:hypothetical protein VCRA2121O127_440032 [Vibrio crassostreae]|nr:hypothetical protein VCRA2120E126_100004 [Vibrio crassostreae]CAK3547317.1 hypothetical protein VCRA2121O127_440032 [Vibrio crassostreae]CAK3613898.1 hypothetical protein VCRA2128O309_940006 [Vibrio crassostreae]